MSDLHPAAATGFARSAVEYEAGRPGYPPDAVDWLEARMELGEGTSVVDLAAGTGKLTRRLARRGARVIAVEPLAEMRALIAPPAEVMEGSAEALPLPNGSVDAVTVAQAFHWFDAEAALAEIGRVLRPGGRLGLIWNRRGDEDPVNTAIERLVEPHRGDTPSHRGEPWRQSFERSAGFGAPEERGFDNPQRLGADQLAQRIASISFIASLPEAERERVVSAARELAAGGSVTLRQRTDVQVYPAALGSPSATRLAARAVLLASSELPCYAPAAWRGVLNREP